MQGRRMQERDVRQVWVLGPPLHTSTPPLSPALFPWAFSCFLLLAPLSLLVMSHHSQLYLCEHAVQQFTLSGKLARFYLDLSFYKAVLHQATKTGSIGKLLKGGGVRSGPENLGREGSYRGCNLLPLPGPDLTLGLGPVEGGQGRA